LRWNMRTGTLAARVIMKSTLLPLGLVFLCFSACEPEKATPTPRPAPSVQPSSALPAAATLPPSAAEPGAPEEPIPTFECADGPNVDFKEPVMEAEVRRKLQKPEGPIKKSDLKGVKSLNLARTTERLSYLDPCVLPHLTKLQELFLGPGKIRDLAPIAELSGLLSLRASLNPIKDVSPLAKLTKLDRLDLGQTQVSDVSPLAALTDLTELMLDSTEVTDVSPLASLTKLEVLSLKNTRVKSVAALKPLTKLETLNIADSDVEDEMSLGRPGLKVVRE
jgi:internalin A